MCTNSYQGEIWFVSAPNTSVYNKNHISCITNTHGNKIWSPIPQVWIVNYYTISLYHWSKIIINYRPTKNKLCLQQWFFHSSPPSVAYMSQWTGPALVKVMACRLFGAKPLPEPMPVYCQLDSREQISVKFESEFYDFHLRNFIWKCRLPEWQPFCPEGDGLRKLMFVTHLLSLWEIWHKDISALLKTALMAQMKHMCIEDPFIFF